MLTAETTPLAAGDIHALLAQLDDPCLARIERLRLLGGVPRWEVYCYGRLTDGRLVQVDLGAWRLRPGYRTHLQQLRQRPPGDPKDGDSDERS
ncbi:hypothetical protein [Actinomadura kijaniata]|uniref:hypothetical protein n=1 Tax=Actinomadura kijaniata TaxID=46161 RepID=UPI0008361E41|nr:hypothetical protein [Actinomadura kijaniata]